MPLQQCVSVSADSAEVGESMVPGYFACVVLFCRLSRSAIRGMVPAGRWSHTVSAMCVYLSRLSGDGARVGDGTTQL